MKEILIVSIGSFFGGGMRYSLGFGGHNATILIQKYEA